MWYKGKMVLSVASYNFLRWHKNVRVVTAFLLDFILCYLLTDKAVQFALERDTTMQIFEAFIWTFGDSNAILLVSLLLLILFADMPFITTATPFYLMRTTRKSPLRLVLYQKIKKNTILLFLVLHLLLYKCHYIVFLIFLKYLGIFFYL